MKKYVIYKFGTGQIVRLTDEQPTFNNIAPDEDYDTTSTWMEYGKSEAIEAFLKVN